MMKRLSPDRLWTGLSPWIVIGALLVLFPIFGFIALENINRQKENTTRLLLEKGAALIRSFEAGTRTGMGMHRGSFQLQKLLTETSQQPDIDYILVVDADGRILADNDPSRIGTRYAAGLDYRRISQSDSVEHRVVALSEGKKTFEVFRKFSPTGRPTGMQPGPMMMRRYFHPRADLQDVDNAPAMSIFIGLDMAAVEQATQADTRHFLLMVAVLLLIGFAGIVLLFVFQSYRSARASLSKIQAFSDTVVESMPIGLVAIDPQHRVVSINAVAGTILGVNGTTVSGKPAEDVLPPRLWDSLRSTEPRQEPQEKEVDCRVNERRTVSLEISTSLLADAAGNVQGRILLFKDLSEVKSLREEIARSKRLATVGRLAAGVAHEVRNPLSSIKGFATYFKERYRENTEDQQIAGIMIQEVDRLNRVVSQLLEFAKPISISKKPVSLNALIEASLKLVEPQARKKGVWMHSGPLIDGLTVQIDPDKMKQVLLNLYLNALESMDANGRLGVDLFRNEKDGRIEIRVSDTGTGIAESDLSHIFDPYYTTKPSGTGLGLAIAHNIVQGHKGEIRVESRPGGGSTFTILLPESQDGCTG